MNPLSMETIFIILSGAILVAGVLYWLWSHIQLTQKKVQLLENAVFELRSMLAARGTEPPAPVLIGGGGGGGSSGAPIVEDVIGGGVAAAKPPSEYKDLEDDDWHEPADADVKNVPLVSTPLDLGSGVEAPTLVTEEKPVVVDDALMPGGRSLAGEEQPLRELTLGDVGATRGADDERFREFFKQPEVAAGAARTPESLESMPVKELRRLAEQRGIAGAADMRKKEILAALRQQIMSAPAPAAGAEVTIEKENAEVEDLGTTEAEILE
jgi:hypothetical protein